MTRMVFAHCLSACPAASPLSRAAFSCWTSWCQRSQQQVLEKQQQSGSGVYRQEQVSGAVCHHRVWWVVLCKGLVEMAENVFSLKEGTGDVVGWFAVCFCLKQSTSQQCSCCGSFLHILYLNCKHNSLCWWNFLCAALLDSLLSLILSLFFQYCINIFWKTAWNSIKAMPCQHQTWSAAALGASSCFGCANTLLTAVTRGRGGLFVGRNSWMHFLHTSKTGIRSWEAWQTESIYETKLYVSITDFIG